MEKKEERREKKEEEFKKLTNTAEVWKYINKRRGIKRRKITSLKSAGKYILRIFWKEQHRQMKKKGKVIKA